ncbi:MAG: YlbF family regulator [Ruminococcus sp.]|nr:YlbF family regulator [Ruminococcus sp.]
MDKIIEHAREIGRLLQNSEPYKKLKEAETLADKDEKLQNDIKEFNLKRLSINVETQKVEKDGEKIANLNREMQAVYAEIMSNEHMKSYNEAKQEFDNTVTRVVTIIQNCAQGEDPDTTDFDPSCTGSCSTCGGCG